MGPANVAPWLEQVGDGLAEKLTVGRGAEIFKVTDGHQADRIIRSGESR